MKLEALFDQPQALPSAPGIVQELIHSFSEEHISIPEITKKISADQVLSAKLLRLANSAHYHVSRTIGTVDHAVIMLGFVTVRTLVISSGLTSSFKPTQGFALEYFWRYSLHTAVVAKWLARKTHQNLDMAFTIGLMHAIGQLIMHSAMPEQCRRIDEIADPWNERRLEIEKEALGYHFATVSAELANRWKFPADFAAAIEAFPEPLRHDSLRQMAAIVHLAAWFARAQKNALSIEEMQASFPDDIGACIGLTFNAINDEMPSLDELSEGLDLLITG